MDADDPPRKKKPGKSTFPKERLYQLQKNYRERKKDHVKKLERDLEDAKQEIAEGKAALKAAHHDIVQLKLQVAKFRFQFQVANSELEETKLALNFLRGKSGTFQFS